MAETQKQPSAAEEVAGDVKKNFGNKKYMAGLTGAAVGKFGVIAPAQHYLRNRLGMGWAGRKLADKAKFGGALAGAYVAGSALGAGIGTGLYKHHQKTQARKLQKSR
jgi:hypothetical protein